MRPRRLFAVVPPSAVDLPHALGPKPVGRAGRAATIEALATVPAIKVEWQALRPFVDAQRHAAVAAKLERQAAEAKWWRDASVAYFQNQSRLPLPSGARPPAHDLAWYKAIHFDTVPSFLTPGAGRQLVVRSTRRRSPMRTLMLIAAAALAASCSHPATAPENGFAQVTAGRSLGRPQYLRYEQPGREPSRDRCSDRRLRLWAHDLHQPASGRLPGAQPVQHGDRRAPVADAILPRRPGPRARAGAVIAGPSCNLGDWVPYQRP